MEEGRKGLPASSMSCEWDLTACTGDDLRRYEYKIRLCGGLDPFKQSVVECDDDFPDITREDLVEYLVLKTDFISLKQLKCCKSLDAHNFVTSGHVKSIQRNTAPVTGRAAKHRTNHAA
ncbi:hypothetical protein GE061_008958 [Apolygus lucorum]|uniref:Uncharacterized protein n=1 Tax=Apolygus lucorum TaxID=248454 RepID=A0A8S9Y0B6_APOLU|nr:hypothetical protein GE061_008958 [Apolygus lucorum]